MNMFLPPALPLFPHLSSLRGADPGVGTAHWSDVCLDELWTPNLRGAYWTGYAVAVSTPRAEG